MYIIRGGIEMGHESKKIENQKIKYMFLFFFRYSKPFRYHATSNFSQFKYRCGDKNQMTKDQCDKRQNDKRQNEYIYSLCIFLNKTK